MDELKVDENELEDAAWFEADYVREMVAKQGAFDSPEEPGGFHVPSRVSLARTLIEFWLNESDA